MKKYDDGHHFTDCHATCALTLARAICKQNFYSEFRLAKELQADEAVCIKSKKDSDHLLTLFSVRDPEAAVDGEAQFIADSWNLGHAVLYEDSIYAIQGLGCSVFSPLNLPEEAKEDAAHVEMILQNMINGRFFIEKKRCENNCKSFERSTPSNR